ncbi:hypothetical protein NO357_07205 [Marimonas arenosa]|uniref:Uncharacterized protein n=1 Tax=Marimonas arenosa TaxID=1795305 RepID=A0AAE3WB21_9RHOB|nr:hypothetical protein [Marimonas arenosa]MDQ2089681.1 hypothetical protein [Marimonas arenosa]
MSARTIPAIRFVEFATSSQIDTLPQTISSVASRAPTVHSVDSEIPIDAKASSGSGYAGKSSFLSRASRRHFERLLGCRSNLAATSGTVESSTSVSATIPDSAKSRHRKAQNRRKSFEISPTLKIASSLPKTALRTAIEIATIGQIFVSTVL